MTSRATGSHCRFSRGMLMSDLHFIHFSYSLGVRSGHGATSKVGAIVWVRGGSTLTTWTVGAVFTGVTDGHVFRSSARPLTPLSVVSPSPHQCCGAWASPPEW